MKLRNPPPKRVKLTKKLGYEALKLLKYIDFRMTMTRDMLDFQDWKRQVSDDMCAVLANMNSWWDDEKRKRKEKREKRKEKREKRNEAASQDAGERHGVTGNAIKGVGK